MNKTEQNIPALFLAIKIGFRENKKRQCEDLREEQEEVPRDGGRGQGITFCEEKQMVIDKRSNC